MNIEIKSPETPADFKQYYHLRWLILRAPWHQSEGSEKDELENEAVHRMVVVNDQVVAVGRLHFIDKNTAQIRYMAVDKTHVGQGSGKAILLSLEHAAKEINVTTIMLHAREAAVGFYQKQGYRLLNNSHLLFDQIQHVEMKKYF